MALKVEPVGRVFYVELPVLAYREAELPGAVEELEAEHVVVRGERSPAH